MEDVLCLKCYTHNNNCFSHNLVLHLSICHKHNDLVTKQTKHIILNVIPDSIAYYYIWF